MTQSGLAAVLVHKIATVSDFDESQVGSNMSPLSRGRRDCSSSPWKIQRSFYY